MLFPAAEGSASSRLGARVAATGATVTAATEWADVVRLAGESDGPGLILADHEALRAVWPRDSDQDMFRPPARPPEGWYVVSVRTARLVEPEIVLGLHRWGVREQLNESDLSCRRSLDRLVTRSVLGTQGARIRRALVGLIGPGERGEIVWVTDASLAGIARKDRSVAGLARRVHMSCPTLTRAMRRAGLVTPSRFIHRTRAILAVLLRQVPASRNRSWRTLGFGSPVHECNAIRANLGRPSGEWARMPVEAAVPGLIERLLRAHEGVPGHNLIERGVD